jgi:hypothetical protein
MIEYVKLTRPEVVYSQKNLFKAQLELINTLKFYNSYKKLRKEEFVLKVALKSKIDEVKNSLKVLDSLMPKIKMQEFGALNELEGKSARKKRLSLEQEIDLIKKKLANLK